MSSTETVIVPPILPGQPRKNDALFMYGALQPKPFIYAYKQEHIEIVHGPSCRREEEIHIGRCEADHIPVIERRSGGGTVVLAPGMVIVVIVGERSHIKGATDCFNTIHDAMISLLSDCGVLGIVRDGISDCAIGSRKILGSSLYMGTHPPFYYYQSSLLVDPDISLFGRYLKYPPREPEYRNHRTHEEFCTSLVACGIRLNADAVARLLNKGLKQYIPGLDSAR